MGSPSARTKWLITLGAPIVALLALELGLRLAGFQQEVLEVPVVIWQPKQDEILDDRTSLHRVDPWSLWAPRPGAFVQRETGERIGRSGFRGPEPATEREPGVLRVVLLGESSTFGMGVPWEQSCAPRLRALLAERGLAAEVVNAGVIGHTVLQGVGRYRSAVRPLRPDIVVIAYGVQNEHTPCQGPSDREKLELARQEREGHPSLWVRLSRRLRVLQLVNWIRLERELPELQALRERQNLELLQGTDQNGRPDWSGCRRVPLDDFEAALRELCADVAADGGKPILCSLPRVPGNEERLPILSLYSQAIEQVGRQLGVPVADARAALQRELAAGADVASFFVATDTWHLGPQGQELLARQLADTLAAEAQR